MKKAQGKRVLAWGIALCLILAALFSAFYIAAESRHDCTGDNCPICVELKVAQEFLSVLKTGLVLALLFGGLRLGVQKVISRKDQGADFKLTPVELQVKLLN